MPVPGYNARVDYRSRMMQNPNTLRRMQSGVQPVSPLQPSVAPQPVAVNPVERPNLSNRQPMSSAAMNNNPMGVQQSMQPTMSDGPTTPSRASLIQTNPYVRQPVSSPSRAMLLQGNPFKPMQASSLETALAQDSTYVNPAADKSYDGPRINPFFKPQGRDSQNPSQFAPQNIQPGSGNFVDQGGQTQPRVDISMARNVMAGQPEGGSRSFGQPMNVPGATQTLGGQVVSPPQRYGQEGVIPGASRGMTPLEGKLDELSPDAFRVATGGQVMEPYVPSGVQPTNGQASRQATIANRNARARGVRGSDVAQWRATNPMALMQKEAVANQEAINTSNVAANNWLNQGNMLSQPEGQQFSPTSPSVNPFNQAPQVPVNPLANPQVNPFAQGLVNPYAQVSPEEGSPRVRGSISREQRMEEMMRRLIPGLMGSKYRF